jgi:hypothetical protein
MQEIELQSKGIEEFKDKLTAQIMAKVEAQMLKKFAEQDQKLEQRLGQKLDNHSKILKDELN